MKIVPPSVELIHCTPDPDMVVERYGRIAYQSFDRQRPCPTCRGVSRRTSPLEAATCPTCRGWGTDLETARKLVAHLLKLGHMSVFEHVALGVSVVTDRGVTHEYVRHRTGIAFTQESTRYCGYDGEKFNNEIRCIEPPTLDEGLAALGEAEDKDLTARQQIWRAAVSFAEASYHKLRGLGVSPQIARSVLPTGLKSEIGVTANAREWHHVLTLRLSPRAHPQMVEVMSLALPYLVAWMPQVFGQFQQELQKDEQSKVRHTKDGRRIPVAMETVELQCADDVFRAAVVTYAGERFMRLAVDVGADGELWQVEFEAVGWRWPKGSEK